MLKKAEHFFNLIIGLIILNNLYYLVGIFNTNYLPIILICLFFSFICFIKSINLNQIVNSLNNWNTVFYLVISIPLAFIDYAFNGTTPVFNDFVRVILYATYFAWTFSLNNTNEKIKKWLLKICIYSIIILVVQGIIENYNPILFSIILSSNIEKRLLSRIAGTLIDSNSYSGALCTYAFIIYYEYKNRTSLYNKFFIFLLLVVSFYFTNLAGSRQGLLMLITFLTFEFFKQISIKKVKLLLFSLVGIVILVLVYFNSISNYVAENPSSSFARLFFTNDNERSLQSNMDRSHSLTDGINLIADNYFIYGPGMLNFASRWASFSSAHEPHNGILFIIVQYGILAIIPIWILYLSAKRAYKVGLIIFFITFFIHLSLQPNEMYYGNMFLCLFYIDTKHYFLKNENISL